MSDGVAYLLCFIGGTIFGGALVSYYLKKQLSQLADMIKTADKKKDPADWWKGEEDD